MRFLMKAALYGAAFLFSPALVLGQGAIQQSGPVIRGHAFEWYGNGIGGDAGPAGGDAGKGLSETLQVNPSPNSGSGTGPLGAHNCMYSAPVASGAYYYLCLDANAQGGGLLEYGNGGTAPPLPFQFVFNGAPPQGLFLPILGGTMAGPIQFGPAMAWSGTTLATNPFISEITTWTGSNPGSGKTYFNFLASTDSVDAGEGAENGASVLGLQMISGGAAMKGQRNTIDSLFLLNSPSGNTIASGSSAAYSAGRFTALANVNDGGISGTPWGALFGGNIVAQLLTGATFWAGVTAMEFDISVAAGASVQDKIGFGLTAVNGDAVNGTRDDIGFSLNNQYAQGSGAGWMIGIGFGRAGGWFPMNSAGTMMKSLSAGGTQLAAWGIDFSSVTFSGGFLKSNNFQVNGTGGVFARTVSAQAVTDANFTEIFGATTGNAPGIQVGGTDTNVNLNMIVKGTGNFIFQTFTPNNIQALIVTTPMAISYPVLTAAASGNTLYDVGGTVTGISIGPSSATGVVVGRAAGTLGFYGASAISKATPTGACAGNTGCQALRDAIGNLGFINTGSITN